MARVAATKEIDALLTVQDRQAAERIKTAHGLRVLSEAVRYALGEQALRDLEPSKDMHIAPSLGLLARSCDQIKYAKGFKATRSGVTTPEYLRVRKLHLWVYEADVRRLANIKRRWRLRGLSEVIRFCLRVQAAAEGYSPEGGWR